jgi:hypothetical protein
LTRRDHFLSPPDYTLAYTLITQSTQTDEGCTVRMSDRYEVHGQERYWLSDLMRDVGGMANALVTLGALVMTIVQDQMFNAELIRQVYQMQKPPTLSQDEDGGLSPAKKRSKDQSLGAITGKTKVQVSPQKGKRADLHKVGESFSSSDAKWLLDFEPQLFFRELVSRIPFKSSLV